jgi:hypothetical protein
VAGIYLLSNLLAVAVGALLFQQGTYGGKAAGNTFLQGVGISVLAAGVTGVVLMGYVILTDTLRNRITVLESFGINDYFDANTTPIKGEYAARLDRNSREIDVLGLGLNSLRKDFGMNLRRWAEKGRVRILLIDPSFPDVSCSISDQRDREELDAVGTIRGEVDAWLSQTRDLRAMYPSNLQIRLYKCIPTVTMVRVDGELFWSPYLMHRESGSTPTMLVSKGGLIYNVLSDHFDSIWSNDSLSTPPV